MKNISNDNSFGSDDLGGMERSSRPFGYMKPPGAITPCEFHELPEAIIREIFRQFTNGASYSQIASWLNQ